MKLMLPPNCLTMPKASGHSKHPSLPYANFTKLSAFRILAQFPRVSQAQKFLSAPAGLFHCPSHIYYSHISTSFTFRFTFSPPSLRPGVVVVCLVTLCHSACAMISGILAGDPWFPHGAVLLPSPACMTLCVCLFLFLCLVSCLCLVIIGCDDTMLPSPVCIHQ